MHRMHGIALLLLNAGLMAQTLPEVCPADLPVDEIITAIQKQQSKKAARNKNPLPDNLCIIGWCRKGTKTPPTMRETGSSAGVPAANGNSSSSKPAVNPCDEAMEKTLTAAHDVEVGDYYFEDKNYKAASFRYEDALQNKPNDAAIYVRLGRAYERLKARARSLDAYRAALKAAGPEKWADEARRAIEHPQ